VVVSVVRSSPTIRPSASLTASSTMSGVTISSSRLSRRCYARPRSGLRCSCCRRRARGCGNCCTHRRASDPWRPFDCGRVDRVRTRRTAPGSSEIFRGRAECRASEWSPCVPRM
jgi:hypothetical protein